jgi:hypothetical protein
MLNIVSIPLQKTTQNPSPKRPKNSGWAHHAPQLSLAITFIMPLSLPLSPKKKMHSLGRKEQKPLYSSTILKFPQYLYLYALRNKE